MKNQRGYTITELLIVLGLAVSLVLIAGGLYVAFHFLAKFW